MAREWYDKKEGKQAEFLIEHCFPYKLIDKIGVFSKQVQNEVIHLLTESHANPVVKIKKEWYY